MIYYTIVSKLISYIFIHLIISSYFFMLHFHLQVFHCKILLSYVPWRRPFWPAFTFTWFKTLLLLYHLIGIVKCVQTAVAAPTRCWRDIYWYTLFHFPLRYPLISTCWAKQKSIAVVLLQTSEICINKCCIINENKAKKHLGSSQKIEIGIQTRMPLLRKTVRYCPQIMIWLLIGQYGHNIHDVSIGVESLPL